MTGGPLCGVARRVLGVEPDLDRVPARLVHCRKADQLALRHRQLQLDQVDTVDELGDRVLDLEAGVHLQEEEPLGCRGRRGTRRSRRRGSRSRRPAWRAASCSAARHLGRDGRPGAGASSITFWWRRCTEQSRFAEDDSVPEPVADDLHLDVAAALDVGLDEDRAVAEAPTGLGLGRRDLGVEVLGPAYDAHAATAAAGAGLDEQGEGRPVVLGARTGTPASS